MLEGVYNVVYIYIATVFDLRIINTQNRRKLWLQKLKVCGGGGGELFCVYLVLFDINDEIVCFVVELNVEIWYGRRCCACNIVKVYNCS